MSVMDIPPSVPAVEVQNLTFRYRSELPPVLSSINFVIPQGARVVVTGPNGAGKSTFLRVVAGQHNPGPDASVNILGYNSYYDSHCNILRAYLGSSWGERTVAFAGCGVAFAGDLRIGDMMKSLQEKYSDRAETLRQVLGIDLDWSWGALSDGQRRRVQLYVGMLAPYRVVLLDEVTALLDLLCRRDVLRYLKRESEERKTTVLVATHVFDGIDSWPTHMLHIGPNGTVEHFIPIKELKGSVYATVECWLEEDRREDCATKEKEEGEVGHRKNDPLAVPGNRQGGYAAGRGTDSAWNGVICSNRTVNVYSGY